jgi:hypothetical protein
MNPVKPQNRLRNAIKVVTISLTAFSGFLKGIAPPEDAGTAVAIGMAAISGVFSLLLIGAIAKGGTKRANTSRTHWIIAAMTLFLASVSMYYVYFRAVENTTFTCPPTNRVTIYGQLNLEARQKLSTDFGNDFCLMIRTIGSQSDYPLLSQPGSISNARMALRMYYIVFVIMLLSSIFCLTDGAFQGSEADDSP